MIKIYTRTGDAGTTGIYGGARVAKDDVRIEANGSIDELNCELGIVRTMMSADDDRQNMLFEIQNELMSMMSIVATPDEIRSHNPNSFDAGIISRLEEIIDKMTSETPDGGWFILPGGTPLSAHLQMARAMTRRAERRLWTLNREDPVPEDVMKFMNRLSDLFFTMARHELFKAGLDEEKWKKFSYKRNK